MSDFSPTICDRCHINMVGYGALSRTCRNEGDPMLMVCNVCGTREAYVEWGGASYGLMLMPWTQWPLSIDALLAEDRLVYETNRPNG